MKKHIKLWILNTLLTASLVLFLNGFVKDAVAQSSPSNVSNLCDTLSQEQWKTIQTKSQVQPFQITSELTFLRGGATSIIQIPRLSNDMVYCSQLIFGENQERIQTVEVIKVSPSSNQAMQKLTLKLPNFGRGWQEGTLLLAGFSIGSERLDITPNSILIAASSHFTISDYMTSIIVALIGVLIFYTVIVLWVSWDNQNYPFEKLFFKPVALTSGHFGRASLSIFQIFVFTLVVLFKLVYTLSRDGILGNLSSDVLLLLGISAVGTAGSKVIAVGKKRLTFSNWSWLRTHKWLTSGEQGFDKKPKLEEAKWSDLIKTGGVFDVYSFQLLGFSFLVAFYLLFDFDSNLATFELPDNFLPLLGLSNVVYLGGKVVDPNSYEEINQKINDLRTGEIDLIAQYPQIQPEDYGNYIAKARIAAEMLRSLYGQEGTFEGQSIKFEHLKPFIPQQESNFQLP